ncbi:MAG TPA: hypothetical protein VKS60_01880 [Stellaceae bacterium]|nr:hypothetical protein [Stellaceae bacterium]
MAMRRLIAAIISLAALAGCDPAQHPFEDDRPPADSAILQVKDSVGIVVAPVQGAPGATGNGLSEALASAFRDLEIPATTAIGNRHSYQLAGVASADTGAGGSERVAIHWSLRDSDGKPVGTDDEVETIRAAAWAGGKPEDFADLAKAEAKKLSTLIVEAPPVETPVQAHTLHVASVDGAPGDGSHALPSALAYLLKRRGLPLTDDAHDPNAVTIAGQVTMSAPQPGKQHVKIVWHVLKSDGTDIGQIAQENDVPQGSLDGKWGETAMAVAMAGFDDILRVVAAASTG